MRKSIIVMFICFFTTSILGSYFISEGKYGHGTFQIMLAFFHIKCLFYNMEHL